MVKSICVIWLSVLLVLCSCTAENSQKPLICEAVSVVFSDGGFDVYASFTTSGSDTMTDGKNKIKRYRGKTAGEALDVMIATEKDAMFKPIKSLLLKKESPYNPEIVRAFINRSILQLKCDVYETSDGMIGKHNNDTAKGIPFPDYYRKIAKDSFNNEA